MCAVVLCVLTQASLHAMYRYRYVYVLQHITLLQKFNNCMSTRHARSQTTDIEYGASVVRQICFRCLLFFTLSSSSVHTRMQMTVTQNCHQFENVVVHRSPSRLVVACLLTWLLHHSVFPLRFSRIKEMFLRVLFCYFVLTVIKYKDYSVLVIYGPIRAHFNNNQQW